MGAYVVRLRQVGSSYSQFGIYKLASIGRVSTVAGIYIGIEDGSGRRVAWFRS